MTRLRAVWPSGLRAAQVVAAALVCGVGLALALAALLPAKARLTRTNAVRPDVEVARLTPTKPVCQTDVLVPEESAALRVVVGAYSGPRPRLTATLRRDDPPFFARGSLQQYADGAVAVRIPRVTEAAVVDSLCLTVDRGALSIGGQTYANADAGSRMKIGGRVVPADMSLQFVRAEHESLLSMVPAIFERAALFRPGWVGDWTYWALAVVMLGLIVAAVLVLLAHAGAAPTLRRTVVAVGAIAFANAAVWSLVTPAFEPPDEAAHYAYVESIVERGELPRTTTYGGEGSYTLGAALAIEAVAGGVVLNPAARPPWTRVEEGWLDGQLDALGSRADDGGGGYTTTAGYSPLYYGLEAAPYAATQGASIFSRLWAMRLLSVLMAAATAVLAMLFAREVAPGTSWFAPVAGLAVAFQPMFAFLGGAVNNDNLLILLATLELYLLARALRRGLDVRLAAAIGGTLALGIAAKPTMLALVPVAVAAVAWLVLAGPRRAGSLQLAAVAAGAFGVVIALRYGLLSRDEAVAGALDSAGSGGARPFQLRELMSYTWQWYLPALHSMYDFFPGVDPPVYDNYFKGFWANFAHVDTRFPEWVYRWLSWACAVGVGLLVVTVVRARRNLRAVLPFVVLGGAAVAGFALLVNVRSYLAFIQDGSAFAQGRYLLPAVAVFGAAVAGAALAFGRRHGLVAGTVFVTALALFNAFSLGLVLTRFYA